MANQKRTAGADLWFVTSEGSGKLAEIEADPHVNVAYYKDRTREWISVSGLAKLSRDRPIIRALYAPDWKMWFPEEGHPRHGTAEDPRIVAIGVTVHSAVFLEVNKPQPIVLFELVKGWVTGTEPKVGEMHTARAAARRCRPSGSGRGFSRCECSCSYIRARQAQASAWPGSRSTARSRLSRSRACSSGRNCST